LRVFDAILSDDEASRATSVVKALLTHGFRGALTGGVAIEAHLLARGRRSTGSLAVVALEDLVARTTAHVYAHLREGRAIDAKYARNFLVLAGCGSRRTLEEAWQDHRQDIED
jgi:hypothetical protein